MELFLSYEKRTCMLMNAKLSRYFYTLIRLDASRKTNLGVKRKRDSIFITLWYFLNFISCTSVVPNLFGIRDWYSYENLTPDLRWN